MRRASILLFVIGLLFLLGAGEAHAYIDPATGSFLLQIAAAAAFGALFVVKKFWRSITGFFARIFKRSNRA